MGLAELDCCTALCSSHVDGGVVTDVGWRFPQKYAIWCPPEVELGGRRRPRRSSRQGTDCWEFVGGRRAGLVIYLGERGEGGRRLLGHSVSDPGGQ